MTHRWKLLLAALVTAATPALSQAAKITDDLDIGGWVWVMYRHETTANNYGKNKAGMDIDEAEMDFAWRINETWDAGISFIMGRWANEYFGGNGSHNVPAIWMLRQGFITGKNLMHEGSYLRIGQQGSPWMNAIERPWGMNWLDGYTVALQDPGFLSRWENGALVGGKMGSFFYDVFYHTGDGFDQNGITKNAAMNWTLQVGYDVMEGLRLLASTQLAGDDTATNKKGVTTTHAAVMYKVPGSMIDVLAEYHMMTGKCGDTEGCTGYTGTPVSAFKAGTNTTNLSASAYGVHLHAHFGDQWGLWARYVAGNEEYANKLAGIKYGQWGPSLSALSTGAAASVLNRTSLGPTYVFEKGKYMAALVYDMGALSNATKADSVYSTGGAREGVTTATAIRANFAAFF